MPKVSVIVPVYNMELYLEQCLDSLLAQTLTDIQIIAVDDGSTDHSAAILARYAQQHPQRLHVVTQANAGLSQARNTGIRHATGSYIGFVDSDDYVAPDMYERLYTYARGHDLDMVACDLLYVYEDRHVQASCAIPDLLCDRQVIRDNMLRVYPAVWNKIYRRMLLTDALHFRPGIYFEDFEWLYRLYPHLRRIGAVPLAGYYYRQREGAITRALDKRLYAYVDNFEPIAAYYKTRDFYEEYRQELEYSIVRYAYGTMARRLAWAGDYQAYRAGVRYARDKIRRYFPRYRRNRLFFKQGAKGLYLWLFGPGIREIMFYIESRRYARQRKVVH